MPRFFDQSIRLEFAALPLGPGLVSQCLPFRSVKDSTYELVTAVVRIRAYVKSKLSMVENRKNRRPDAVSVFSRRMFTSVR